MHRSSVRRAEHRAIEASNTARAEVCIEHHRTRVQRLVVLRGVFVNREVILAAGALTRRRFSCFPKSVHPTNSRDRGVEVQALSTASVATSQNRYAVSVAHRTLEPWKCFDGVSFSVGDPAYREWLQGRGIYRSNGAVMAFSLRSKAARAGASVPDLMVLALTTRFLGYFTGFSETIRKVGRTPDFRNLQGRHCAKSPGARAALLGGPGDPPTINFQGFKIDRG